MPALLAALVLQSVLIQPLKPAPIQTQKDDFAAVYASVSRAIRARYYARVTRKDEMEANLAKYKPLAEAAKSRADFAKVMDQLIKGFNDSHFDFLSDDRQGFYSFDAIARQDKGRKLPSIGAWFKETPQGWTVWMLMQGGEAEKAGLRNNDLLLTIDGKPFTPVKSLEACLDKPVKVKFKRDGKEYETQVTPQAQNALDMFFDATRKSAKVIEVDGKKIGYVRIWTMVDKEFKDYLEQYVTRGPGKDTDAFVYDIRDGFGGRPEGYYEPFFAPQYELDWKMMGLDITQITGYGKPVVLLTNKGTRSAKEVVSRIFKASKRAVLMGDQTAGDVLGTTPFQINDWAYLEIPMVELNFNGVRLEKNPVVPDIALGTEFSAQGEDLYMQPALNKAAELAKQASEKSSK